MQKVIDTDVVEKVLLNERNNFDSLKLKWFQSRRFN